MTNHTLPPDAIAALVQMEQQATAGPWQVGPLFPYDNPDDDWVLWEHRREHEHADGPQRLFVDVGSPVNARLIAALRNAAPALLALAQAQTWQSSDSVILAAEEYAQQCVAATGRKFDMELLRLKDWFYAGARWRDQHPNADVHGPQSSTATNETLPAPRPSEAR